MSPHSGQCIGTRAERSASGGVGCADGRSVSLGKSDCRALCDATASPRNTTVRIKNMQQYMLNLLVHNHGSIVDPSNDTENVACLSNYSANAES